MFRELSSVANYKDIKGQPLSNLWKVLWVNYTKWFCVFLIRNSSLQIKRHSLLQIYMLRICQNYINQYYLTQQLFYSHFKTYGGAGDWTRGLALAKRALPLSYTPIFLCFMWCSKSKMFLWPQILFQESQHWFSGISMFTANPDLSIMIWWIWTTTTQWGGMNGGAEPFWHSFRVMAKTV